MKLLRGEEVKVTPEGILTFKIMESVTAPLTLSLSTIVSLAGAIGVIGMDKTVRVEDLSGSFPV